MSTFSPHFRHWRRVLNGALRTVTRSITLRMLAGLGLVFVVSGALPSVASEEPKRPVDDKTGFSDVDRNDPEALKRRVKEQMEKQQKEWEKKNKAESKKNSNAARKAPNETGTDEAAGDQGPTRPPRAGSLLLLEEGATSKPDERLRVAADLGMPKKGSILERMRSVMATKCLDEDESLPYVPSPATIVDLDAGKPWVPPGYTAPKAVSVDLKKAPPPATAVPENMEELQAESERRFLQGLDTRDTVIRDWSFRFGATYRRAEAVPAMVRELKSKGWLSTLAAVGLGQIGDARAEVVEALEGGLSSKDAGVRQACTYSLGQLHVERAARPLAKLLRGERNYQVRTACCSALGMIGDRDAVSALRLVLKAPDEAELVKAEAALALTRLGDRQGVPYLEACYGSPAPQLQLLGLTAFIELREPSLPSKLINALGARYDEVWLMAVRALPSLGPGIVQAMLRDTLGARLPQIRHRAALALGLMGDRQALPHIQQTLMEGGLAERQMAAELLGLLGHRESIPLLMDRLNDSTSAVRVTAAVALARLDAKEALPALVQAARGPKSSLSTALSRGGPLDVRELMILLGCIRTLKGEEGSREFATMPDLKSTRWPEYEKELEKYQFDVLRGYQLVEVMGSSAKAVAVVLRDPQGQEQTYRENEAVASGFRVREMRMGRYGPNAGADAAWVVLQRGITRVTLLGTGQVDISEVKIDVKPKTKP